MLTFETFIETLTLFLCHQTIDALCQTNDDCGDPSLCCVLTPLIVRKRLLFPVNALYDTNLVKHECLPYKGETSRCYLRQQYSPEKSHYSGYSGGCPCKAGFTCTPTDETTSVIRWGKCTPSK